MPIVGTRAAQYAGWWNQGGNLSPSITDITTTTGVVGGLAVRPSYYIDFAAGSASQDQHLYGYNTSGSNSIDLTSIGTNAKKQVFAMTFKVGTNWMTTAPSGYVSAFGNYYAWDLNGSQSYRHISLAKDPSDTYYVFGTAEGTNVYVDISTFNSTYRNRWLTCIYATSNSSGDFANWQGGSDTYGNSWAARVRLFDTATMTLIPSAYSNQGDGWLFNSSGNTPDLTQAWTLGYGTSTNFINNFGYFDGDSTLYYRNDLQVLSNWYAIGDTVDIGDNQYYNQLAGSAMSKTVGGIKPIGAWAFNSVGTGYNQGGFGTNIYTNPQYTWARLPANSVIEVGVSSSQNPPDPAEFISL